MNLDPDQIRAVESVSQFTMVSAGPGGGKTRVIVERIKHKIATGSNPRNLAVMTFTNAGANELTARLGGIRLAWCGTLHGWCFRLLQNHGSLIGYREGGINLIGTDLSEELLQQVAKDMRYKKSALALSEARDPLAQLCHKEYRHRLKASNLVDYDGVLVQALQLIKADEDGFDLEELLVDETQDSALIDWEIYEDLGADSLFVVGDEKQSIFGFRGAYPKGFTDAAIRAHVIKLQRNYRSGVAITTAATRLIGHNSGLIAAETISATGTEGTLRHDHYATDLQERSAIAGTIAMRLSDGSYNPSYFAILCRTHALCASIRDSLAAAGVPVQSRERQQLPQDFGLAMDVLSLFADPRSDLIAERVIKHRAPDKLAKAKALATKEGIWLSSAAAHLDCFHMGGDDLLPPALPLDRIPSRLAAYHVDKETCDLVAARIASLPQPEPTLADLRHDLFDLLKNGLGDAEAVTDAVFVGTGHSAKGREWDVVFAPAWEEGILPSLKKDSSLEEERRLAFTIVTRARHEVYISSAAKRQTGWKLLEQPVSRFVAELGI